MQPNAAASFASAHVVRVGIVDRQRARAIQILERIRIKRVRDVINAQWRFEIAFHIFLYAHLAHGGVVIGHELQALWRVFEKIQTRSAGIDRDSVLVARRQAHEI